MRHAGTTPLETSRLHLRRLTPADGEMMFRNWTSDEKVTKFLRWDAHKTLAETESMLSRWVDAYSDPRVYYWGIYLKDGEMLGSVGISIASEQDHRGELGYKIGSRWWGFGYTSEAVSEVIDYMFRNTDMERIDAFCSVENPASAKVMQKAGMYLEGRLGHFYKTRDGFHDCLLYAILRKNWKEPASQKESGSCCRVTR